MKKLQSNFTTPEQSRRLLELGVPADSADCYYDVIYDNDDYFWKYENHPTLVINDYLYDTGGDKLILPCWSVGRLIEILFDVSTFGATLTLHKDADQIEDLICLFQNRMENGHIDFSKLEE